MEVKEKRGVTIKLIFFLNEIFENQSYSDMW